MAAAESINRLPSYFLLLRIKIHARIRTTITTIAPIIRVLFIGGNSPLRD